MPWFRIDTFDGAGGATADLPAQAVPPGTFTAVRNVTFKDGAAEKAVGMGAIAGTLPAAPKAVIPFLDQYGTPRLFVVCGERIYSYVSGAYTDIGRGAYTVAEGGDITGCVLHGVPIINMPLDIPQYWNVGTAQFENLLYWPSQYFASSLRPYKNFLLALGYTTGGNTFPHSILWSHPASPGTVPPSWDIADTSKDAGTMTLSETEGSIIDGHPLGPNFVVYKEDAIYMLSETRAPYILSQRLIVRDAGALARNCIATVNNAHIVLGRDDVYAFNGQAPESLVNRKWRRRIFSQLNSEYFARAFVVSVPADKEVWFCIPTSSSYPQLAFVWNWGTNAWSERDLPKVGSVATSIAIPEWDTYASTTETYADSTASYDVIATPTRKVIFASPDNLALYTLGGTELLAGAAMTAYLQHDSYDFGSVKDPGIGDRVKHVSKIRPRVTATAGVVLQIQVGTQMNLNDAITWTTAQNFTVGTTEELCFAVNGRYISWKISSTCNCTWRLEALDFLLQAGGSF